MKFFKTFIAHDGEKKSTSLRFKRKNQTVTLKPIITALYIRFYAHKVFFEELGRPTALGENINCKSAFFFFQREILL